MDARYSVKGDNEALVALLATFPGTLDEKLSKTNWDFKVPEDRQDDFTDYCEQHNLECELV
jgi:hypothetical protein